MVPTMVKGNIVKNTQDYVNWDHYRNVDQSRTRVSRDEADIKEALARKVKPEDCIVWIRSIDGFVT